MILAGWLSWNHHPTGIIDVTDKVSDASTPRLMVNFVDSSLLNDHLPLPARIKEQIEQKYKTTTSKVLVEMHPIICPKKSW